jgi:hypothetical protein
LQWARWNWLAVALLPIAWTYSVLPLVLSLVLLFHKRRVISVLVGLVGFGPLLFAVNTASPFLPLFCTVCVGLALAVEPLAWPVRNVATRSRTGDAALVGASPSPKIGGD